MWGISRMTHQHLRDVSQICWVLGLYSRKEILLSSACVLQIKICAEYRDMLPRPRLVCQEPGLRPIGLSPGVPDKSSRGLGSMSRYSAQILICFIAYIFHFFIPLWVWLETLQDCHYARCPLPLSIVIRIRLVIRQSKLPTCLVEVQLAHVNTLWHLCHRTGEIDRYNGWNLYQWEVIKTRTKWMESFLEIPVSNFTVLQLRIYTDYSSVGIRWSQVVLKIHYGNQSRGC